MLNSTLIGQSDDEWSPAVLGVLLLLLCIFTVAGNILVVVAVLTKTYLQNPTGYLIVSLAGADLLVGTVVMPINSIHEMANQRWIFASLWFCDVWHSIDILASTASIWNLCVISLDRYTANKDPIGYPDKITTNRILVAIAVVWSMSASLSFPAIAIWRLNAELYTDPYVCAFTDNVYYVSLSSLLSFFIPLAIILFAYGKVFLIATRHSRTLRAGHTTINGAADGPVMRVHYGKANPDAAKIAAAKRQGATPVSTARHSITSALNSEPARPKLHQPHQSATQLRPLPLAPYSAEPIRRQSRLSDAAFNERSVTARHCQKQLALNRGGGQQGSLSSYQLSPLVANGCAHAKRPRTGSAGVASESTDYLRRSDDDEAGRTESARLLLPSNNNCNSTDPKVADHRIVMTRTLSDRQLACGVQKEIGAATKKHRLSHGVISQVSTISEHHTTGCRSSVGRASQTRVVARGESIDTQVSLSSLSTVKKKSKHLAKYLKEQRAARTLGLVVGLFIMCWLPFFVVNILIVICPDCMAADTTKTVFTVLTWLGHLNSSLNPLIYSRFSREFRRAFKEILTCQKKRRPGLAAAMQGPLSVAFGQIAAMQGYRGPIPQLQADGKLDEDDDEEF